MSIIEKRGQKLIILLNELRNQNFYYVYVLQQRKSSASDLIVELESSLGTWHMHFHTIRQCKMKVMSIPKKNIFIFLRTYQNGTVALFVAEKLWNSVNVVRFFAVIKWGFLHAHHVALRIHTVQALILM